MKGYSNQQKEEKEKSGALLNEIADGFNAVYFT
jgi:hypothetical protein